MAIPPSGSRHYIKWPEPEPGALHPRAARASSWSVPNVCAAYDWPTRLAGGGVIGIVELGGGWVRSDVDQYFASAGLPGPSITDVSVDGSTNQPGGEADGEVALNIQVAAAAYSVATGRPATLRIWVGNAPGSIASAIRTAATDGCDTISISWGADESVWEDLNRQTGRDYAGALEVAAQAATDVGAVVFAAAGDNDASDGGPDPANVDLPASCPHVIGCGGTTKARDREVVWNNDPGNPDGHGTGGQPPRLQRHHVGRQRLLPCPHWPGRLHGSGLAHRIQDCGAVRRCSRRGGRVGHADRAGRLERDSQHALPGWHAGRRADAGELGAFRRGLAAPTLIQADRPREATCAAQRAQVTVAS